MFDNFSKVYESIEDLAVKRMYVDPDVRSTYPNISNKGFSLPTVKSVLQIAANLTKYRVIQRYKTPKIRRYDRLSGVTVGCGVNNMNKMVH